MKKQSFDAAIRTIFEHSPLATFAVDSRGVTRYLNQKFTEITGYTKADLPTDKAWLYRAYPDPKQRTRFLAKWREQLEQGFSEGFVHPVTCRDGRIRQIEFIVTLLSDDMYIMSCLDITESKANEKTAKALYDISNAVSATRDLDELYAAIHGILHDIVDATNFFISLVDEENDRLVFPYFADELDDYYDIENISDPETKSLTLSVIRSGTPLFIRNKELNQKTNSGELRFVGPEPAVWLGSPLTVKGKVIGAMAVQHYKNPMHYCERDIRLMSAVSEQVGLAIERKASERALSRLNQELESKVLERTCELDRKAAELTRANQRLRNLDKVKSALISSVSHELRTPLTSIMGFAKIVHKDFSRHFNAAAAKTDRRRSERLLSNLEIINSESERLTRMINEMLDLSKIESGRSVWSDRPLDPGEALLKAANAAQGVFNALPETELTVNIAPNLPPLTMDPDKLQQVLMNLLANASKFTPSGTVVLSASAEQGTLTITVRDTGVGVAPEDQARIFDTFYKAEKDDTLPEHPHGAGLGLAICKQIVEHYGGVVRVESVHGEGSAFIVELPTG